MVLPNGLRLFTQLNDRTNSSTVNCAVHTLRMGIAFGTLQRWVPTVAEVRRAAGDPVYPKSHRQAGKPRGLTAAELNRAFDWCVAEARRRGFALDATFWRKSTNVGTARQALRDGYFLGAATKYAVIIKQAFALAGQKDLDYRVNPKTGKRDVPVYHELGMWGFYRKGGINRTTILDPLYDGRRKNIPKGPQADAPFPVLRDAMAGYAGSGYFIGFAIRPAAPAAPPPETDADKVIRLERELASVPGRIATAIEAARTEERARASVMIETARSEERAKVARQVAAAKAGALAAVRAARADVIETATEAATSTTARLDRLERDLTT